MSEGYVSRSDSISLSDAMAAGWLPSGWQWRGFSGANPRGNEYLDALESLTEELRASLHSALEAAECSDETRARLSDWADEANPLSLAEWLEREGGGWQNVSVVQSAERAFIAAATGKRRRHYLARLEHKAQNGSKDAAAILADKALLERLLCRLARPDRPLAQERPGRRPTEDFTTITNRKTRRAENVSLFPGLSDDAQTPEGVTRLLQFVGDAETPPFAVTVKPLKGLSVLAHFLSRHEWSFVWAFVSNTKGERWLNVLAAGWMDERIGREEASQTQSRIAVPLQIQRRNVIHAKSSGADYLRFPAVLKDAGAWCSPLVELDGGGTVFAQEPNLPGVQLYQPRTWAIAPEHVIGHTSGQMALPGFSNDAQQNTDLATFLAVAATDAAAADTKLPGVCAKLIPLLFALCPLDGTPIAGTYRELAKLLWPDWRTRRRMPQDCASIGQAAAALRQLRIVQQQPGRAPRMFNVLGGYWDLSTDPEAEASFSLDAGLLSLVKPERGLGNFFLVNLSRLMELDARDPRLIAVALRLYAYWHTCKQNGQWQEARLRPISVDDLLVTAATVSERVGRVIAGGSVQSDADKRKLTEARAEILDRMLPKIQAGGILGGFEAVRPGRGSRGGWAITPTPPADYHEAGRIASKTRKPPRRKA